MVLAGANSNSSTCATVPGAGGIGGQRKNDSGFAQPSRSDSFSLPLIHSLCAIVYLGRLLQGGAPLLMFVQPVGELSGPSDLSPALSLANLSPITQAVTFINILKKGQCLILCRGSINLQRT